MKISSHKETFEQTKERAVRIVKILIKEYSRTTTALQYSNPFQLLIAVILSAQCTDVRVNMVTPVLFSRFKTPQDFSSANITELEKIIHSTGFYHNKAKNIKACAQELLKAHNGIVPHTLDELYALPGVGRKTANVVLGEAFGKIEGIVVDTHVTRLSNRLALTQELDAVKIENDLMPLIPRKKWYQFSHSLIFHGRKICKARNPICSDCSLSSLCPSSKV